MSSVTETVKPDKTPKQAELVADAETPTPETDKPVLRSKHVARAVETPPPATGDLMVVIAQIAQNPNVDITRLERLIDLKRTTDADRARAEFYAAFAEMQGEIPEVSEKGEITVEGKVRSRYARNEDIQRVVKPILKKHGFALSFRNEWLADGKMLKVVGILAHKGGHTEQDEFIAAADTSGSKNAIQALGSTRHYGQRYTTISLLNIATSGDDDGKASGNGTGNGNGNGATPEGFQKWFEGLEDSCAEGIKRLEQVCNANPEFKKYLLQHMPKAWASLKNKAEKAGKS